jgi:DNA-binding NtrC family response regulator
MNEKKTTILVVDDEEVIRDFFRRALLRKGYNVETAESGKEALACLEKQKYQIVLLDVKMPKLNGLEVLKIIKNNYPEVEVIMVTGHGTMRMAQESLQLGAYDYLTKPVDINDLCDVIESLSQYIERSYESELLYSKIPPRYELPDIQGESAAIKSVLSLLEKIAPASSNVLIQGETGSGKEVVAHHIHRNSQRRNKPFVVVNCAALPDTLLESELFGYETGAFTDASKLKRGLLEVTNGGTLFLDEVSELSPTLQAKLLRVVETGTFRRLGSNKEIQVDIRAISATNKDLTKEINARRFREDLFYRLGVISINMPPLRERKDDIPLLVNHFLKTLVLQGKKEKKISQDALEKLKEYIWPGNIRELRNVIERMVVLTDKDCIESSDLLNFIREASTVSQSKFTVEETKDLTLCEKEKEHIKRILEKTKGNQSKAAKILGISRRTLYYKIKDYELK